MREDADLTRAALERLLDLVGETAARQILAEVARPAALAELERLVIIRLARQLLAARALRSHARDRLVARGISRRTAYRAIEAALDNCAAPLPAMAREAGTLQARQQLEATLEHMDIKAIKREVRGRLEREREGLAADAAKLRQRRVNLERAVEEGNAEVEALLPGARAAGGGHFIGDTNLPGPAGDAARASPIGRLEVARRALGGHEYNLRRFQQEEWPKVAKAEQRVRDLDALLMCEERFDAAVKAAQAAQSELTRCAGVAAACERAVASVEGILATARREAAEQCASAAAGLLSAVKAGSTPNLQEVDGSRLAIIEVALGEANAEAAAARAAKDDAHRVLTAASTEVAKQQDWVRAMHGFYTARAVEIATERARSEVRSALAGAEPAAAA